MEALVATKERRPACLVHTKALFTLRKTAMVIYYTKSLVNTNSFYTNFTNMHFQKVHIPHLTRTIKQKFLH